MNKTSSLEAARETIYSGVNQRLHTARTLQQICAIADWITVEATRLIGPDSGFTADMLPTRIDLLSDIESGSTFNDSEIIILRSRLLSLVNARVMDATHARNASLIRPKSETDATLKQDSSKKIESPKISIKQ